MGKGSAVAAAPPFFCARVAPVRVAAGAPTPGNPSSVRPAETPASGVGDSGAAETATRRGHVSHGRADVPSTRRKRRRVEGTAARPWLTRATAERALLVPRGGGLAVTRRMPSLGTAG